MQPSRYHKAHYLVNINWSKNCINRMFNCYCYRQRNRTNAISLVGQVLSFVIKLWWVNWISRIILIKIVNLCNLTFLHWLYNEFRLLVGKRSKSSLPMYLNWSDTPTLIAFTGVTNDHGHQPQPTACRSPTCSLMTTTGSNQASGKV